MKMTKVQAPKVRGRKLTPGAIEVTERFKKKYPKKDLEQLWGALVNCYGSEELALQAAQDNYQILNPSYTFTNTMLASKQVLVDMMGKEEALEVMLLNPAVLQCGPSLDTLGPDEIKGFANIRALGKRIPQSVVVPAIVFIVLLVCYPILAVRVEGLDSAVESNSIVTNIIKAACGIIFAVAIEGSRLAIVGTIVKAKMSGDERIDQAQANERRRMGKK